MLYVNGIIIEYQIIINGIIKEIIIEYQNMINLLGNTSNQPSKFGTKIWAEINDGTYNTNDGITPIVKLNLKLQC